MNKLTRREIILIMIFLMIATIFFLVKYNLNSDENIVITNRENNEDDYLQIEENINEENSHQEDNQGKISEEKKEIFVDICGAVNFSQVVKLKEGDRVIDAVELAGGLTEKADVKRINLAKILYDGEKIIIPEIGEIIDNSEMVIENNIDTKENKININTASIEQLKSLNGVGDVLAERIIEYRKMNNGFKTIEEIKSVSGIGEKKFEGIKDGIKVN